MKIELSCIVIPFILILNNKKNNFLDSNTSILSMVFLIAIQMTIIGKLITLTSYKNASEINQYFVNMFYNDTDCSKNSHT